MLVCRLNIFLNFWRTDFPSKVSANKINWIYHMSFQWWILKPGLKQPAHLQKKFQDFIVKTKVSLHTEITMILFKRKKIWMNVCTILLQMISVFNKLLRNDFMFQVRKKRRKIIELIFFRLIQCAAWLNR